MQEPTEKEYQKTIKRLLSEGYKLKAHHSNPEWKKALEDGEELMIRVQKQQKPKI